MQLNYKAFNSRFRLFFGWSYLCVGVTATQLAQLREALGEQGIGRQGRSRSETDLQHAVYSVGILQQNMSLSANQAINQVAAMEIASPATVRSAVRSYSSSGTVTPSSAGHRGRGNPNHPLHNTQFNNIPFQGGILMHRMLDDVRKSDTYASAHTLQLALAGELSIHTSLSTVTRWLHSNGYSFRKKRFMGTLNESVKNQRMRAFIAAYARALREERGGRAKIVYTDESYLHSQHNKKMS